MSDTGLLVRAILAGSDQRAEEIWRQWRREVDVQRLSWPALQLLPILNRDLLHQWLAGDPDAAILQGVVRRAWTEAQIRQRTIRQCIAALELVGCGPVLTAGPAAVSAGNRRPGSVRPITEVQLVVPRSQSAEAARVLIAEGWNLQTPWPENKALSWTCQAVFVRDGLPLRLIWRLVRSVPWRARAFEDEFAAAAQGASVVPPEYHLLALLTPDSPDDGLIPWQVDAALLPLSEIDWDRWSVLAARHSPGAFQRLAELRDAGLPLPCLRTPPLLPARVEWRVYRALRAAVILPRRITQSLAG